MASSTRTVSFYFYSLLIKYYLPLEAKYVSLIGYKDYRLVTSLIEFYLTQIITHHNQEIREEEFDENYGKVLESLFCDALKVYIKELLKLIEQEKIGIDESTKAELISKLNSNEFFFVIKQLEKKLGIYQNPDISHNTLAHIGSLQTGDIFKNELDDIVYYIRLYIKMYQELAAIEDGQVEYYSEVDYLKFVVCHEFLSALSHYSTAVVYFDSPKVFITNLERTIAHLKRSLMDIYDGLIMHYGYSKSSDYIKLRTLKVNSLGQKMKMKELISELDKYYDGIRPKG